MLFRVADWLRDMARKRCWDPDQATGRRGEDLVHRFLRRAGYTVVARNYRPPAGTGEIDLVAWEGPTLVFVEVKSRASEEFGTPDRAVDEEKQRNLERAARDYARRAGVEWGHVRFDVATVVMYDPPQVNVVRDAFRAAQRI